MAVGDRLESQTYEVTAHSIVTDQKERITFVDIPGFEDSREDVSDVDVVRMFVDFLRERYRSLA